MDYLCLANDRALQVVPTRFAFGFGSVDGKIRNRPVSFRTNTPRAHGAPPQTLQIGVHHLPTDSTPPRGVHQRARDEEDAATWRTVGG